MELANEERMLAETMYKWAVQEIAPLQEKIDDEDWFPEDFFRKLGELGMLGITIDEEYGGVGQGIMMQVLAVEQLSRISPALGMTYGAHSNLCANNIHKNGTEAQKSKYLPPCARVSISARYVLPNRMRGPMPWGNEDGGEKKWRQVYYQRHKDVYYKRKYCAHLACLCENGT